MNSNKDIINKTLLRKRFGSSAPHYDQSATPQRQIADELIKLVSDDELLPDTGNVFEVGCGTGFLSTLLIDRFYDGKRNFTFNDLSPEVEHTLRTKVGMRPDFIASDAEHAEWEKSLALVASSSCIQWWHAPLSFIAKSSLNLRSEGILLYSTFLPDNMTELRAVTGKGLNYPTESEHLIALKAVGFKDIVLKPMKIEVSFGGIIPLLKHLKLTGTNSLSSDASGLWSQARVMKMEVDYRKVNSLRESDPLTLTYSALLVFAKKK